MSSNWTHLLSRQVWPKGDLAVLLKVALLDEAKAAICWNEWKSRRDIESVTWEEHKLFARLAGRIAAIAPDCPNRPRLEGLAKAHWTQSQVMLRSSASALDILIAGDIPVMLLKGGALHAAALANQGPRITGDLDVLVRRADFPRAIKLVYAAGWTSKNSVEFSSARWRFASGTNLRLRPHGDIDIHHQPVHGARVADEVLDALWARAEQVNFHGRSVLIPSPADLLVFASAHAVHSHASNKPSAAWVFDLAMLVQHPALSPDKILESASAFKAVPATLATLSFLHHQSSDPRIGELIWALENYSTDWRPWLQFLMESMRRPHGKLLRSVVRRISRQVGLESERNVVPRIRPRLFVRHASHEIIIDDSGAGYLLRHEITLPSAASMAKRLVLELTLKPAAARRHQLDISADGTPLARLSARVYNQKPGEGLRLVATLPSRGQAIEQLAIESLGTMSLPTNASTTQIRAAAPVPFRIIRLSWD